MYFQDFFLVWVIQRDKVGFKRNRTWDSTAAAAAKWLQSCPTLCDPIDGSPPGCPIPGILQARTLERVAISFSNAWKWKVKVKSLSHVRLLETPWTASPPGSSVQGIFQARVLEWGAIAFSMRQHSVVEKSSTYKGLIQLDSSLGLPWAWLCDCGLDLIIFKVPANYMNLRPHVDKALISVRTSEGILPCSLAVPWRRQWQPTPVFLPGES